MSQIPTEGVTRSNLQYQQIIQKLWEEKNYPALQSYINAIQPLSNPPADPTDMPVNPQAPGPEPQSQLLTNPVAQQAVNTQIASTSIPEFEPNPLPPLSPISTAPPESVQAPANTTPNPPNFPITVPPVNAPVVPPSQPGVNTNVASIARDYLPPSVVDWLNTPLSTPLNQSNPLDNPNPAAPATPTTPASPGPDPVLNPENPSAPSPAPGPYFGQNTNTNVAFSSPVPPNISPVTSQGAPTPIPNFNPALDPTKPDSVPSPDTQPFSPQGPSKALTSDAQPLPVAPGTQTSFLNQDQLNQLNTGQGLDTGPFPVSPGSAAAAAAAAAALAASAQNVIDQSNPLMQSPAFQGPPSVPYVPSPPTQPEAPPPPPAPGPIPNPNPLPIPPDILPPSPGGPPTDAFGISDPENPPISPSIVPSPNPQPVGPGQEPPGKPIPDEQNPFQPIPSPNWPFPASPEDPNPLLPSIPLLPGVPVENPLQPNADPNETNIGPGSPYGNPTSSVLGQGLIGANPTDEQILTRQGLLPPGAYGDQDVLSDVLSPLSAPFDPENPSAPQPQDPAFQGPPGEIYDPITDEFIPSGPFPDMPYVPDLGAPPDIIGPPADVDIPGRVRIAMNEPIDYTALYPLSGPGAGPGGNQSVGPTNILVVQGFGWAQSSTNDGGAVSTSISGMTFSGLPGMTGTSTFAETVSGPTAGITNGASFVVNLGAGGNAFGVQALNPTIINNLYAWTTGPTEIEGDITVSTSDPNSISSNNVNKAYFFINLDYIFANHPITSFSFSVRLNGGSASGDFFTAVWNGVYAEVIHNAQGLGFGSPNSQITSANNAGIDPAIPMSELDPSAYMSFVQFGAFPAPNPSPPFVASWGNDLSHSATAGITYTVTVSKSATPLVFYTVTVTGGENPQSGVGNDDNVIVSF